MSLIDEACEAYERQLRLTWREDLAGPERVWMLTYRPDHERRLRHRLGRFETATAAVGRAWHLIDITTAFEDWLSGHEYRDEYLADPESLEYGALDEFADHLAEQVRAELVAAPPGSVAALLGAASLFGLTRLSRLIVAVAPDIPGRLLVFFPGTRDENNYRLLDGHDGFDYLAVPIN
jgi:hypothetical protein